MGCRGCGGLGATMSTLKTGGGIQTSYPCPADHPYFPKSTPLCDPTIGVFAYKSTVNGALTCLNGSVPTPGVASLTGKSGMVCPGAKGAIPSDPNAPVASDSAGSNTTLYIVGGLAVFGIAAYLYLK